MHLTISCADTKRTGKSISRRRGRKGRGRRREEGGSRIEEGACLRLKCVAPYLARGLVTRP